MTVALPTIVAMMVMPAAALAQDHGGHGGHSDHQGRHSEPQQESHDAHSGHGSHSPAPVDPPTDPSPGPTMETPPPRSAGNGPPRAADAIWGAEAMRPSRQALAREHGNFPTTWIQVDRAEVQFQEGANAYLWDVQGYSGGPTSRFWFKSEGEGGFGEGLEDAEVQALWSRAVGPYWDVQLGVRQDLAGPDTTHAVVGIQGLAPYVFEIDAALFVSTRGDVTARIEAEVDQRVTRRLILQPRAEITLAAQDIRRLGVGAGVDSAEIGLRLRYEIVREFAPYIGIEQGWRLGKGADFALAAGEDSSTTRWVAGIRFWF